MKLVALWVAVAQASWADHHQPPITKIYENDRVRKINEYSAYISQPVSEGSKFVVHDHKDQAHGIKDGMFTYESIEDDGQVELYIYSRENLDREQQESYKFKIDLLDKNGNVVQPAPVWYSEFRILDRNDNAPQIDDGSKVHNMEEDLKPGQNLPSDSNVLNKQNGKLLIIDADKAGADSMNFDIEVTDITLFGRDGTETTPDDLDHFRFEDTSDEMKKQIVYQRKIPSIEKYNRAVLTLTITDCAVGCPNSGDKQLSTKGIKVMINILDKNTHSPVLKQPLDQFIMDENTSKDVQIGSVITATDADVDFINRLTTFQVVSCSIDHNPSSGCSYFRMRQTEMPCNSIESCKDADLSQLDEINQAYLVTTEVPIDYERIQLLDAERRYVSVTIIGENTEALNPLESDPLTIRVYVEDVNEKPQLQPNHNLAVFENKPAQTIVGTIQAIDPENSEVEFIVDSPYFEVTSNGLTGTIKTKDVLDREADYTTKQDKGKNTIRLVVTARETDENPALESVLSYDIEIKDQNDNGPSIGHPEDNNLFACSSLAPDHRLTRLPIFDPDRAHGSIQNQGGQNQQYYKFDPIMDSGLPFEVEIRQDLNTFEWGLYSVEEFAEWPSNIAYSVQITGKDSNIEQTVTSTTVHLNMCHCNATETENPSCAEFIVGPQTAGMDWWIWLIIVLAVLAFVIVGLIVGRTRTQQHQILDETNPFDDEDDLKG